MEINKGEQSMKRIVHPYLKKPTRLIIPSIAIILSILLLSQFGLGLAVTKYYEEEYVLDSGVVVKLKYIIDKDRRQEIGIMKSIAKEELAKHGLMESLVSAILWKYPDSYEVLVTRELTATERNVILHIPWDAPVKLRVTGPPRLVSGGSPCDFYFDPPSGVCIEYADSNDNPKGNATIGFRARDVGNPSVTGAVASGHGGSLGLRVYHPQINAPLHYWWGNVVSDACTTSNLVDANFIERRPGSPELLPEVLQIGPVVGTMAKGDVGVGLVISSIGRFMGQKVTGYVSDPDGNYGHPSCPAKLHQVVVTLTQGQAGGGDSGAPICVDATVNGQNVCLRLSILWGINSPTELVSSYWEDVEAELGVEGY